MTQIINNWKELSKVPPNDKYQVVVDENDCCGWIIPIEETEETKKHYLKYHRYLSTHTFYGITGTPNILKEFGWDLELANWDEVKSNKEVLNVGEWIRTKDGKIGKILSVDDISLDMDEVYYETTLTPGYVDTGANDIKSHNKDILKLIEVGDIIGVLLNTDCKVHYYEVTNADEIFKIDSLDLKKFITKEELEIRAINLID